MVGPDTVWLFNGWYTSQWWTIENDNTDCSVEELEAAATGNYYISTRAQILASDDEGIIGDIVSSL